VLRCARLAQFMKIGTAMRGVQTLLTKKEISDIKEVLVTEYSDVM